MKNYKQSLLIDVPNEVVINRRNTMFTPGTRVCLSAYAATYPRRATAKVETLLGRNFLGGVRLDRPLEGTKYWRVNDLVLARNVPANQKAVNE